MEVWVFTNNLNNFTFELGWVFWNQMMEARNNYHVDQANAG